MSNVAEFSALRGLLEDPSLISGADLHPEHLTDPGLKMVLKLMLELSGKGLAVDAVTIMDRAKDQEIKETVREALVYTMDGMGVPANYKAYERIVLEAFKERRIREIAGELVEDPASLDRAIHDLASIETMTRHEHSSADALRRAHVLLEQMESGTAGISTGFPQLDEMFGGMVPGRLTVIGGRPAMGKTALGARLILNSSDPSALLSSEMAVDQITLRMICSMAGISSRAIRQGMTREELDRWTRSSAEFLESPIYINDRPGITPDEIARQARKWKYHNGVKLVIIDYLQRLGGKPGQDRVERIREAIQAGKEMARQLDIHVVMLSQVSRDVERRDDKRPSMADFDGASTIEAEADHAIMIYRPAVYSNLAPKRLAELLVVKNRHGPIGTVVADFEPETVNFSPSNQPASPF